MTADERFDHVVLALIFLSCVALAVDSPLLDPSSALAAAMRAADLGLTLAFTVEAGLKVLALGPKRYARDSWNALDVVVLALAYGEMLATAAGAELSGLSAFKAVRAMRALRPLRAVRRLPGLRVVVETLLSCVPDVLSVVSVLALVVLVFALFALTYLKGALNHCAGDAFDGVA